MTHHTMHCETDGAMVAGRRRELGLSREELAVGAGVGLATIFRVETGRVRPHRATVAALARALGCEPKDLYDNGARAVSAGSESARGTGRDDRD